MKAVVTLGSVQLRGYAAGPIPALPTQLPSHADTAPAIQG
jgi:hypothetical protein